MERIAQAFAEIFGDWGLTLPKQNLKSREKGRIHGEGWTITFVFGTEDGEEYVEFYATHRMTNDRHTRIYESGRRERLDAMGDFFTFDSRVEGTEREGKNRLKEHNARVLQELKAKGLAE